MATSLVAAVLTAAAARLPTVKLNTGAEMPTMLWGSGGSTQENATSTAPAVAMALEVGFPGLDCANHYHNQVGVAAGIKASGVKAADIWLETKVEPCGHSLITPVRPGHCFNDTLAVSLAWHPNRLRGHPFPSRVL